MSMKKRTTATTATKKVRRGSTTKVEAIAKDEPLVGLFTLPAECTTHDAGELKTRLLPLITHPETVTLDRGSVQRVDTATLQMLAAFVRDRHAGGLSVEWSGEGAAFKNAASLLGLSSLL
jgi:anti-anti-sigma regulatory factor